MSQHKPTGLRGGNKTKVVSVPHSSLLVSPRAEKRKISALGYSLSSRDGWFLGGVWVVGGGGGGGGR